MTAITGAVERVKKIRDYAFVHFTQREDAIHAMNALNGKVCSPVVVAAAPPPQRRHHSPLHPGGGRFSHRGDSGEASGQGQLRPIH